MKQRHWLRAVQDVKDDCAIFFGVRDGKVEPLRVSPRVGVDIEEEIVLAQGHDAHPVQIAALEVRVEYQDLLLV